MSAQNSDNLAAWVRRRRRELHLTQEQVAAQGGPSDTTVAAVEAGNYQPLRPSTLQKFDVGLRWELGSAANTLAGGEPTPADPTTSRDLSEWESSEIAKQFRYARECSELTQQELAQRASVSVSTVRDIESGRPRPRWSAAMTRIANELAMNEEALDAVAEWSITRYLRQAQSSHGDVSGRQLAEIAQRAGHQIDRTQINQILSGRYLHRPSDATLDAVAYLAKVPASEVRRAADRPTLGAPFSDQLPSDVDALSDSERLAVLGVINEFLRRHRESD